MSECLGSLYTHHDNTFNIHVTFRKRKTAKQDNKICYLNNNNFKNPAEMIILMKAYKCN